MKRFIIILIICILAALSGLAIYLVVINKTTSDNVTRIGIGGGGAFFNPMIDPTDENVFYVTSDMGALYYSYDKGQIWNRSVARGVFTQTHIADNGIVFCGGYGLYVSCDKGKSVNLIYPKDVKYSVSRYGWNENLMLAQGYDNGYVKSIITSGCNVYFVTIDWEGNLRFLRSDYEGNDLKILQELKTPFLNPMNDVDIYMATNNAGIYITIANKICFYDFETGEFNTIYTTTGYIRDICTIQNKIFFIDDLEDRSLILYTEDFVTFCNLLDKNTLTNEFTKYGRDGTFNWHFKEIVGNNFENIYLSFSSSVNEFDDVVDGIMKFNGKSFEWIFDSMYKTRFVTDLNGWSYGSHGPFYGITADPHNDNNCLVANIETVYLMKYEDELNREIKPLHCKDYGDGRYSTNGLDVQTTYFVKEEPFDKNHIIICTTDMGLQNSYDGGQSWQRMEITGTDYDIYNTCYDLYFDKYQKDVIYALWSSRHDAPYNPTVYDKETTKGALGVSNDGGKTWEFRYNSGLPVDSIPVKMSVKQDSDQLIIAVATFNHGFYLSQDGGESFVSINSGMESVEDLIFGEDIIMTEDVIYCLTAPYLQNGTWQPSKLYEFNISNEELKNIDLGEIVVARSLTYSPKEGLFINVIPTNYYNWFEEYNNGLWVNENGGIYHYTGGRVEKFFDNNDGIFFSTFSPDGKMYATDTYGKVFVIDNNGSRLIYDNLFTMLKNISFSLDGKIMYITTFGGGTYKIKLS